MDTCIWTQSEERFPTTPELPNKKLTSGSLTNSGNSSPSNGSKGSVNRIIAIFRDAQQTTASHRKLAVTLKNHHEACCYETNHGNRGHNQDAENQFNQQFLRCVLHVLPVRKSETAADRVVRFVGFYLRFASNKDLDMLGHSETETSLMPETPSARLSYQVLEAALPLMTARDKTVRYRSTQLISQIINSLDVIDDELFQHTRIALLKRIRDKEAMIRAQAVLGLGRLAGNQSNNCTNSDDSDEDQAIDLLDKLLDFMQNDPSAIVRRSLLVNLPILPSTLPYLLERARDQDAATRQAVYSRLLPALGDFRHLSLSMREKLLRWGLRDRDENVRKAAGRLFRDRWISDCVGEVWQEDGKLAKRSPPSFDGLLELLERIDIINSSVNDGVALEAMRVFWEGRLDYRDALVFNDNFWNTLSAESAFLVRSFNEFYRSKNDSRQITLIDEKLPEVTKFAFYLERYLDVLCKALQQVAQIDAQDELEGDTVEQEFIVEQLLQIALTLDYSDEVGRRKMFSLLRQTLSNPQLPEEVTKLTVQVLGYICAPDTAGEREFCSIVLESVADVHDTVVDDTQSDDADESFHSATSKVSQGSLATLPQKRYKDFKLNEETLRDKAIREIVINMKCLHMVKCMLTYVAGSLKDNADLVSMLNNLVVPAVRSHEAPVREKGLVCLGLCTLLDRSLAEENMSLFIHFFSKGHPALQITALHILTDILVVHGSQLLYATPSLLKVYVKAVKGTSRSADVQAAATIAASKLLLGRVVNDKEAREELLKALVIAYFDPYSASNQAVRQSLNYFLPVFCYSHTSNQDLMRTVSLQALHALLNLREGLEDDNIDLDADMVSMTAIGACLADWTDPRKCYSSSYPAEAEKKSVDGDIHLDLGQDILERLRNNISKEEKKILASLLGKLYVSPRSSEAKLRQGFFTASKAIDDGLLTETKSHNSLYKFHVSLGKIVNNIEASPPGKTRMSYRGAIATNQPVVGRRSVLEEARVRSESECSEETMIVP